MTSSTSSSSRRARGLRALSFFTLTFGLLAGTGEVLEQVSLTLDPNLPKVREMMSLGDEDFDVVYLGDSTTLQGLNPAVVDEALDISSYSLATGGQSILGAEMALRHYLATNRAPQVLMLGIFVNRHRDKSGMNPNIFFELSPELRSMYMRKREGIGQPLDTSYALFNRVKAYRHRTTVEHIIKYAIAGESRVPQFIQGHMALDFSRETEMPPGHTVDVDEEALDSLLAFCAEQGLEVLMFEPPNHPGFSELSEGRDEAMAMVRSKAEQPGVYFRSFNDENSLDYASDEWVGLNHLNATGAARFSQEQIVPYLAEHMLPRTAAASAR